MPPAVIGIPVQNLPKDPTRCGLGIAYCRAIEMAGGVPLLIPLAESHQALARLLGLCGGLLLAGGGDIAPTEYASQDGHLAQGVDHERDRVELWLAREALGHKPLLGICRGIQVLNVAAGGTLIADIPTLVGRHIEHQTPARISPTTLRHTVQIREGSLLAAALGTTGSLLDACPVNSTHHQAVRSVAPRLVVSAVAPDGVVEAIEWQDGGIWTLGVQWHPERLVPGYAAMRALFAAFVGACGEMG